MTLGERCIVKAHQYSEGIVQLNEDGGSQCETWLVRPENWLVYLEAHEETEDTFGAHCDKNAEIGEFPMYGLYSLCN